MKSVGATALAVCLGMLGCRGGGERAGDLAPDPYTEARAAVEAGQWDLALAKLQGVPPEAEALYLQGMAWAGKAALAPLPTPLPLQSPSGKTAPLPVIPEFKQEELQAITLLERAVAERPDHALARMALADLLAPHALRQIAPTESRAATHRRDAPTPIPSNAATDISINRVVAEYRAATLGDRKSTEPVDKLIQFATRAGRAETAEEGFQELLRREPEKPGPLVRFGDFLRDQGRSDEGIARYREALVWSNDSSTHARIADLTLNLAAEHLARQEYSLAESRLAEAKREISDPESAEGRRQAEMSQRLSAIRYYKRR